MGTESVNKFHRESILKLKMNEEWSGDSFPIEWSGMEPTRIVMKNGFFTYIQVWAMRSFFCGGYIYI